jgi:hypothetical protein
MKVLSFWFSVISMFFVLSVPPASATTAFPEWKVCVVPDDVCEIVDASEVIPEGFYSGYFDGKSWAHVLYELEGTPVQAEFEEYALDAYFRRSEHARRLLEAGGHLYSVDHNARRMEIRLVD